MAKNGREYTSIAKHGLIWPNMAEYDWVWLRMFKYMLGIVYVRHSIA